MLNFHSVEYLQIPHSKFPTRLLKSVTQILPTLNFFNLQSIEFAPTGIEEEDEEVKNDLALAFANRSAVWNDRGEYALAIRDADLAFEANYPEGLEHKLYERKGHCLTALGKVEEARDMLTKAIEALDKSNLKGERKKAKEKTLQKLLTDLQKTTTKAQCFVINCVWPFFIVDYYY